MSVDQVARVKARLRPELDEPYFEVVSRLDYMAKKRCDHQDKGVRLDEVERKVYCRGCGREIEPFDALVQHARAEQRLVATRVAIEEAERREAARKEREKSRRPFARLVVSRAERKDLTLKAEPVIGYTVTLECGHTRDVGPDNRFRRVTCHACASAV